MTFFQSASAMEQNDQNQPPPSYGHSSHQQYTSFNYNATAAGVNNATNQQQQQQPFTSRPVHEYTTSDSSNSQGLAAQSYSQSQPITGKRSYSQHIQDSMMNCEYDYEFSSCNDGDCDGDGDGDGEDGDGEDGDDDDGSMSDVNEHCIKRLRINEDESVYASDCATTDSTTYLPDHQLQNHGPPEDNEYTRRPTLKRPYSFVSVNATAGSTCSETEDGGHRRLFKRLSTVSIDFDDCEQGQDIHSENSNYENFNSVLGSLHLERRAKYMRQQAQENQMEANSSMSSLASATAAVARGHNHGNSSMEMSSSSSQAEHRDRYRISRQVHLQSNSNLG